MKEFKLKLSDKFVRDCLDYTCDIPNGISVSDFVTILAYKSLYDIKQGSDNDEELVSSFMLSFAEYSEAGDIKYHLP